MDQAPKEALKRYGLRSRVPLLTRDNGSSAERGIETIDSCPLGPNLPQVTMDQAPKEALKHISPASTAETLQE